MPTSANSDTLDRSLPEHLLQATLVSASAVYTPLPLPVKLTTRQSPRDTRASAKLNVFDPYAYIRDVLERLPTQPASRIEELLPHRRQPTLLT